MKRAIVSLFAKEMPNFWISVGSEILTLMPICLACVEALQLRLSFNSTCEERGFFTSKKL